MYKGSGDQCLALKKSFLAWSIPNIATQVYELSIEAAVMKRHLSPK